MENVKAVILAGGFGTRLRPITCTRPKPLCEVLGESVIMRLIRLIGKSGIKQAAVSTMYMADAIRGELGDSRHGVEISYAAEPEPRGSAGGAKLTAQALGIDDDGVYLILSGDGIFDFDLTEAIRSHIDKKADVTIVTYPSKEPLEYGVILSHSDGRIYSFREKPGWQDVKSDTVNTGIYIINGSVFKEIPDNRMFDFSRDLFPHLLGCGKALYSFEVHGYWCDIGDISAYYKCCIDALAGNIRDICTDGAMTEEEMKNAGFDYTLPCYISKSAVISRNCEIGAYTVIGSNSVVEDNASVNAAIVLGTCHIKAGAEISNCIICENSVIEESAVVTQGCTVGAGTVLKSGASVGEGICIWPGKVIEKGFCVTQDILFGNKGKNLYADEGYYAGSIGASVNAEYLAKLGRAIAEAAYKAGAEKGTVRPARLGVMHNGEAASALISEALLCGIKSTGSQSFSFMKGFEAQAKYAASTFMTDYVLFVTSTEQERVVKVFDRLSMPVTREFERTVEACFKNGSTAEAAAISETKYLDNIKYNYYSELIRETEDEFSTKDEKAACGPLCGMRCHFPELNKDNSAEYQVYRAVIELGADVSEEYSDGDITVSIAESGLSAVLYQKDSHGKEYHFDSYHISAALVLYGVNNGKSLLSLPHFAPAFYSTFIGSLPISRKDAIHSTENPAITRRAVIESREITDMCFAVVKLLAILKKEGKTLGELMSELPCFEIRIRYMSNTDTEGENRASVMKKLCEKYGNGGSLSESEGVCVSFKDGNVTVVPRRTGGFRLISEAASAECAEEICAELFEEIRRLGSEDNP